MDNLINYNGTLLKSTEVRLSPDNRGFYFGDGFFESLVIINGSIPLWTWHLARIKKSSAILRLHADHILESNFLFDQILLLVAGKGCHRVKISIFRESPGKYLPAHNETQFIIQAIKAECPMHSDSPAFLSLGRSFQVINAALGEWNQIKSMSALAYVVASLEAAENGFDDLIILTEAGLVSESTNSNIFAIKDSAIITPGLSTGCINGVFREYLIHFLNKNGIKIIENDLFWGELGEADEIFLTNAVQWIRPVKRIDEQNVRDHHMTQEIIKMVRKDLLKSAI